ncbi:unnamed protein product [Chironomus riparius]|uniref:Transmembrane protein n=1 Tax=Chironomus riparius TaxID=315576 RepID=A0A9N9WRQ8_9DIPT|nr:unnamed protein product [Chironomus riparius]
MQFIVLISIFFTILILIELNYGYEANLLFNLSNIDEIKESITGTYEGTNFKDEIMPFSLKRPQQIEIKDMFDFRGITFKKGYLVAIQFDAKSYNFTMKMFVKYQSVCDSSKTAFTFDMDEFLKEYFQCKHQVAGYKSKFYYLNEAMQKKVYIRSSEYIFYHKNIEVYWTIYRSDFHVLNNDRNFRQFLNDCYFINANQKFYLLTFGSYLFVLVITMMLLVCKKIKIIFIKISQKNQVTLKSDNEQVEVTSMQ